MTMQEMREEMSEKRRKTFHQERTWWWNGPNGTLKIGVLQDLPLETWMVGFFKENGRRQRLNSSQLAKYQPSTDPDRLLAIVVEWANKRGLLEASNEQ